MYTPVDKFPHFPTLEKRILALWEETGAFEQLRKKNAGKPKWSFLDGPITANNPMGVHHAWGRFLKDAYQRYHAMCGQELRYQNGFDCQGLWVEVEVEKANGFKSKQDIEQYGVANFVNDCKERVRKFSRIQTDQSIRLGYWMDWDNSYFTMAEENNYTIWSFLKKCHERGYIYKGFDAMPWCPRCGVGLSQMELHEGYKWVEHLSIFTKFPIRGREKEALLVWTTTPWTLTSNVAAAVHPYMKYYRIRQGDWTYYAGADNWDGRRRVEVEEESATGKKRRAITLQTLPQHLKRHGEFEVVGTLMGSELIGLEYDGPFDELPAQKAPGGYPYPEAALKEHSGVACHRVIPWDAVTGTEGTGIVHIAPGCGKEDNELGRELGLVAISPLNDGGEYIPGFGPFSGRHANDVAKDVAANLKEKDLLVATEQYPHRYAHCWRCSTPVVYRLVDEWYINMEWRDEIRRTVEQIRWIPDYGQSLELDWLKNMGDWMISKKRYWGLALPIWQCDRHNANDPADRCHWFTVIGGREELKQKAIAGWDAFEGNTPHRPWVDQVKLRCETCGGTASRVPDVGNPWLDAGIVPYSTMGFNSDREYWKKWFPPELVLECFPGQFRNWFYALLAMNAMMQEDRWADRTGGESKVVPPFKTLLGYALVRDEEGHEMHKSLGNAIEFNSAAETIGAEVMRYIYAAQPPTSNLNFPNISPDRREDVPHLDREVNRKLLTLWNCYSFYVTYAEVDGITPDRIRIPFAERSELDRWILSKFQRLVAESRDCFETYRIHGIIERFERFVDDLSTWYLRRSRRRFWKNEGDTDKLSAYATLFETLEGLCRVMAPILPFLTEEIYQNIVRRAQPDAPVSVHLLDYPAVDESRFDTALEKRIDTVVRYKNLGLHIRTRESAKIRQPLGRLLVMPESADERAVLEIPALREQLLEELNVKALELLDSTKGILDAEVKPNFKSIGQKYGRFMKDIQKHLADADAAVVQAAVANGGTYAFQTGDTEIRLESGDLDIRHSAAKGIAFLWDGKAFVALDTTVTPELKQEGVARDFVRGVQDTRKAANLRMMDRIAVRYKTDPETAAAVERWSDTIRKETLADELKADDSIVESDGAAFKAGGGAVVVALRVV